jgi:hypothetical protein
MTTDKTEQLEISIDQLTAEGLPLTCTEEEDGSLLIEWDETDPRAISLGINDWTEERWTELLREACERANGVPCDEVSQVDVTQPTERAD